MKSITPAFVLAAAGLIAFCAASWAWRESTRTREADALRRALVAGEASLLARERALEERLARAVSGTAMLNGAPTRPAVAPTARAKEKNEMPLAEKSSATTGKNGSWVRAIRSDPTVQALQLAAGRSRLETQFEPLCRSLGLTAQRREKFYANLMERDAKIADVQAATDAMDIGDDDNIMERLFREPMAACETAQRELLGEEGYRQAMEYLALAPAREMVRWLAVVATAAVVALSSQQMEQLVPLLRGPVGRSGADAFMVLENLDWTRLDASVRTVLTNEQFALFQRSEPSLRSSPSRFMRPLDQLIDRARESDAAEDAAKALPKRPGG